MSFSHSRECLCVLLPTFFLFNSVHLSVFLFVCLIVCSYVSLFVNNLAPMDSLYLLFYVRRVGVVYIVYTNGRRVGALYTVYTMRA